MGLTEEEILAILGAVGYRGACSDPVLATALRKAAHIKKTRAELQDKLSELLRQAGEAQKALTVEKMQLQSQCSHPPGLRKTEQMEDTGAYRACGLCGKIL